MGYQSEQLRNVYKIGITKQKAVDIMRSKVEDRKTLEEKFKIEFLQECREANLELEYYPVVTVEAKINRIDWTYTYQDSYVTGYSGSIDDNGKVNLSADRSYITRTGSDNLSGDIDNRGITVTKIYGLTKWEKDAEIEKKKININNKQIEEVVSSCKYEIGLNLRKHAIELIKENRARSYKIDSLYYSTKYSKNIIFYPVYTFTINGVKLEVDAVNGDIVPPDMPHNELFFKVKKKNILKDVPLILGRFAILALLLGFMIYVLYMITNNNLYMLSFYENHEDFVEDKIFVIIEDVFASIIWLGAIIFLCFQAKKTPFTTKFVENERNNEELNKGIAKKVIMNELSFILYLAICFGLICVYIAVNGYFYPGKQIEAFNLIFT